MHPHTHSLSESKPSLPSAILFTAKSSIHKLNRGIENRFHKTKAFPKGGLLENFSVLAESVSDLWSNDNEQNKMLTVGKVQNLRLAARKLNAIEVPGGETFSFWAQVGKPSLLNGFVEGRELREGCIIPSIGGGLCQLSNALYDAAVNAGFEIVERHKHSKIIPGSLAEKDRDATVFWNYIDLRFRSKSAFRIEIEINDKILLVRFRGKSAVKNSFAENVILEKAQTINDCLSCGVSSCFRNVNKKTKEKFHTAYLLDEKWPEFDGYLGENILEGDTVLSPLDGKRFKRTHYAWNVPEKVKKQYATFTTLFRAWQLRKISKQGNVLQDALLRSSKQLAAYYGKKLSYKTRHLVVSQTLLPFLHQNFDLAGRSYDVFMTRLPLFMLQQKLDEAALLHPRSKTLNEFRAPAEIVNAEREALNNARKIITTHPEIAALYPAKTVLLEWKKPLPFVSNRTDNQILFPASALARKGAYELREAAKSLGLSISVMGTATEYEGFWGAVPVKQFDGDWNKIGFVVFPAFIEHQPRVLLKAVSRGIPVIASSACGLGEMNGVKTVEAGNLLQLIKVLKEFYAQPKERLLRKAV
jgi:hypothetical protein